MFKTTTITSAILALAATSALAQETQKLERIEVTGSSIKRVAAETALPITTVSKEEIARSGATTVQDLVQLLPSSFGGSVVANNVGATGGASTANLRGLGAKYTLVLLNGRRVANFAFGNNPVDLNSIPLAAVERVEVVRDGASSIYGADAVAGVINFILRKDYQGAEASWSEYRSEDGGGNVSNVSAAAGFGDLSRDRFNLMITAGKEEISSLKATQRDFANTAVRPDLGINKSSPRNGIPNLNFTDTRGNTYTGVNPLRYQNCNAPEFGLSTFGVPVSPTQCGTDYVKFIDLVPQQWRANMSARGVFQLDSDNQLVAEYMHNRDRVQSVYSPAPYTVPMAYPTTGRFYPKSITLPKGMTLPAGYVMPDGTVLAAATVLANDMAVTPTGALTGTWRTVAGGGRSDITETETDRFLIGARGTLAGWDYDTAVVYSQNKGEIFFGPGKFSYAKLTPLVNAGEINVFGAQDAISQAKLDGALLTGRQQAATSKSTEFDVRVSRELLEMAGGPLAVAMGANYRNEKLNQISEPVLETGDEVGGSGPVPGVTGSRKVYGLFGEVNMPVLKDVEVNLSGRYDNYKNSFGTSFNSFSPKASVRYQPMKDVVLRGSVAKGYRAPTLYENLRPKTVGNNTSANWSDPIRCPGGVPLPNSTFNDSRYRVGELQDECNVQLTTGLEGNKNVSPEKSRQFSAGLVFSPIKDMTLGFDYWNVEIKDPIQPKSEIQVLSDPNTYKNFIYRYNPVTDPNQANPIAGSQDNRFPIAYVYLPYENNGKFYASGLDISSQYRVKSSIGTLGFNFEGALFLTHGYQYNGASKVSDLGKFKDFGAAPRWRHSLSGTWSYGVFDAVLTNNYTHSYDDYTNPAAIGANYPAQRTVKAYVTWDAQFAIKPTKSLTLTAGIKNLTNQDPPVSRNELFFQTGYDATYANPVGRQFYGRISYKFF
ncbi:MAG: TonB-dependent receptor plug domain-containing protein [Roseateles sp.]